MPRIPAKTLTAILALVALDGAPDDDAVGHVTEVLKPGDAYLFDSRIPHRFRNTGKQPCIVVSACSPPTF